MCSDTNFTNIYCTILMRLQFLTLELVNAFQNISIITQHNASQHFAFRIIVVLKRIYFIVEHIELDCEEVADLSSGFFM